MAQITRLSKLRVYVCRTIFSVCLVFPALSDGQQPLDLKASYTKSEHMVPMRDNVKLFTTVYAPKDTTTKVPIMLFRTPYGTGPHGPNQYKTSLGPSPLFARDGFIFVYQDVRGKGLSEGEFVVMKPVIADESDTSAVDETTDTYDTIQWVLENVSNHNGRVGQWGVSYPGWQTVMGMINAHPALKASSPQASPSDMFIGDDFHHNGAFRLMYTFNWLSSHAQTRTGPSGTRPARFEYPTPDSYEFFLNIGPIKNINRLYFQGRVPTWNEYMEHGTYDAYWSAQNFLPYLRNIDHAILNVAGWFDAEDFYGPMSIYYSIEKQNPANDSTLVVGPWLHGGWSRSAGDRLGDIPFGSKTGEYYREKIEFPFFRHHLKQSGAYTPIEAIVFETGRNQWQTFDQWPPPAAVDRNLYFQADGGLSFDTPLQTQNDEEQFDSYVADPVKPVPFTDSIVTVQGHRWMVGDQRFASRRPDVLVYQTEPLTEPITIAGPILAHLKVSTTGTDADYIVKLIDVYPSDRNNLDPYQFAMNRRGYQMLIAGEVMRAKFRNSYSNPEPMVPGETTTIEFDLRDKFHTFLPGHRIMVQVQSSWFPVIDRNPQTFVDIYQADESDFQKATHRVYRSAEFPSHIKLKVLN